jgi:hypothetical protein
MEYGPDLPIVTPRPRGRFGWWVGDHSWPAPPAGALTQSQSIAVNAISRISADRSGRVLSLGFIVSRVSPYFMWWSNVPSQLRASSLWIIDPSGCRRSR